MKKLLTILCALFITVPLLPAGCASPAAIDTQTADNDKITVCTSFYPMYDFTRQLAGDRANIINLVPSGTEPHDWEPSTADIAQLEKADVFIYSGHHMEHWVEKVIASLSNSRLIIAETAADIPDSSDPHVWLDPTNANLQMQKITDALCQADGANADYYRQNYSICSERLRQLDSAYQKTAFTTKDIIVAHEAYGYLCARYGLTQTAVEGLQGESDPSPAKLAEIAAFAKEHSIRYVFAESAENTKILDILAKEIGGEVLILDPFERGTKDYFTVMEENLSALQTALGA